MNKGLPKISHYYLVTLFCPNSLIIAVNYFRLPYNFPQATWIVNISMKS